MPVDYTKLTPEHWAALRAVQAGEGRFWKRALSNMWERASYGAYDHLAQPLQYLRNASFFGPTGLDRLRSANFPKEAA
jgi:hypothetical protein